MGLMLPKTIFCTQKPTDCPPQITQPLPTPMGQTRLCHVNADCTRNAQGTMLDTCCTGMFMGQSAQFCFNQMYAGFTMGAVTCP
jgi:hypothetical protein